MNRIAKFFCAVLSVPMAMAMALLVSGCDGGTASTYSPFVEAFTSGRIGRTSAVYLIFNRDIDTTKAGADIDDYLDISPAVAGSFSLENSRTVVFTPSGEFERGTTYTITADLSDWFDIADDNRRFSFSFKVLPLAMQAYLNSMTINADDENAYDFDISLTTADAESPDLVETLVHLTEEARTEWTHSADGKRHSLKIIGLTATDRARTPVITATPDAKHKFDGGELLTIDVPSVNSFDIYNIECRTEPERYVEVSFTKLLDDTQNMIGLARIQNNVSAAVNVEGNKLRLYPDADKHEVEVWLSQSIRSKSGLLLGINQTARATMQTEGPSVSFVGQGVVVPQSTELVIPFEAVYLRGVVVRVIKVFENNVGQFMQSDDLDGCSSLMRVGRLVARKTIFIDDEGVDLTRRNTFGIDLSSLVKPEPGAIYRVELSFDRRLSAWPCDDAPNISKEQIEAEDELRFVQESSRFDNGSWWYRTGDDESWENYDYRERNNPCSDSYYLDRSVGRNVIATNLGLMAMSENNGAMSIFVHHIQTTQPVEGADVEVFNYQNCLLGKAVTDAAGRAKVQYDAKDGRPFYIVASLGQQRSYLRVDAAISLSTSAFDVSGQVVQKGIKGFVFGERGVWRPADTLHIGFMLNDVAAALPDNHPVTLELTTPMGQLYAKQTSTSGVMGLYLFSVPTDADAPTGSWNACVSVGGLQFNKRLRVESIKPNRLKINMDLPEVVVAGEPQAIPLNVSWLHGAKANGLAYAVSGTFAATETKFDGYESFVFDDPTLLVSNEEFDIAGGRLDADGSAVVRMSLNANNKVPGMMLCHCVTRIYEESGEFSTDGRTVRFAPYKQFVGIRSPQADREPLETNKKHAFKFAVVDAAGNAKAGQYIDVEVFKMQNFWWWDATGSNLANFMTDSAPRRVLNKRIKTDVNGLVQCDIEIDYDEWGTYFVRARDVLSGHTSGTMAYFDWPGTYRSRNADGSDYASQLTFGTDRDTYKPGDKIRATIATSKGGRIVVNICNGTRIISTNEYDAQDGQTEIVETATDDMMPNAYMWVSLLQPHGATGNDMPIRMYGIAPFNVESEKSRLKPQIAVADELKPNAKFTVGVSEADGREMAYTVAIVDEGLLDLTHFATPDPYATFNAREALGVNMWDMYDHIVGAYGGRLEKLFSIGGDEALLNGPKAIVNRFTPVVKVEGPFHLKAGKTNKHTFDMPNYNGRVRVMIVAGDGRAYGNAEKSVGVRDKVMLLGTLPRNISTGDIIDVPATVFATENGVGNVKVSIKCSENLQVDGESTKNINMDKQGDKTLTFRLKAKDKSGTGRVALIATAAGSTANYVTDIEIRNTAQSQLATVEAIVEPGQTWEQTIAMPGADGTNSLAVELSGTMSINIASRLKSLVGYPHGCVEQTTSKAFPQLFTADFTQLTDKQKRNAEAAVKSAIKRLGSFQTASGALAYWPGMTNADEWGSAYAAHFVVEAEAKGYDVPARFKQQLLSSLRAMARNADADNNAVQCYRLYVLALARQAEQGAMNRMREILASADPTSRSLLASAYALTGHTDVAKQILQTSTVAGASLTYDHRTYDSPLRSLAVRLLAATTIGDEQQGAQLFNKIAATLNSAQWLSTQETAFALVAASKYMEKYVKAGKMAFQVDVDGRKAAKESTSKNVWSQTLIENGSSQAKLKISNTGESKIYVRAFAEGVPPQGEIEPSAQGVQVETIFVDAHSGQPVDFEKVRQGINIKAIATVKNTSPTDIYNIVLTQIFPSGWDILSTRYMEQIAVEPSADGISYQDVRDDRVHSYIDRLGAGATVSVEMNVCAAYAGTYYMPATTCNAMYDNNIRSNTQSRTVVIE